MGPSTERLREEETLIKASEKFLTEFKQSSELIRVESDNLKKIRKTYRRTDKAQKIIQDIAKQLQENVSARISDIVTRCIKTVFQDGPTSPYTFNIQFERKRGRTEARLLLERNQEQFNPIDETGGGIVDIVNFALRLVCICMEKPNRRKILFLDEPFKFVSEEYRPFIAPLLSNLAKELDFQIIMVTHIDELQLGKIVRL